jgi:hypothetical protein
MAKTIEVHQMDEELDKLVKEAEEFFSQSVEERTQKMAEVEDLYKGKTAEVDLQTLTDIQLDQSFAIVKKLSLRDVLLFSGQGKLPTHKDKVRLGML